MKHGLSLCLLRKTWGIHERHKKDLGDHSKGQLNIFCSHVGISTWTALQKSRSPAEAPLNLAYIDMVAHGCVVWVVDVFVAVASGISELS